MNWDEYFLEMIPQIKKKSKDPNTKVGSILVSQDNIVKMTGYNGFAIGVEEHEYRWDRPTKYDYVIHSEANIIALCAREGISTKGCTLYVEFYPCKGCADLIINAGIVVVYYSKEKQKEWNSKKYDKKDIQIAKEKFKEAGVTVIGI